MTVDIVARCTHARDDALLCLRSRGARGCATVATVVDPAGSVAGSRTDERACVRAIFALGTNGALVMMNDERWTMDDGIMEQWNLTPTVIP